MFKLMKIRWPFLLIILLISVGLVSCQEPVPPPEPVTITFGYFQYDREYYEPLIEEFQKEHPEITVEIQDLPFIQGYNINDYPDLDVEPRACAHCDVKEACLRGDSGARRRLVRFARDSDPATLGPAERALLAIWNLHGEPR